MRDGWKYKKLGEVGTFQRGKGIQKTDFVENGMPCIHYGQLHTIFGVSTETHLSQISRELYEKSVIASKNDVILALTSEDVEGSCRSTAWLGNYDVAISSDAAVYKHSMNPKFVAYYLRTESFFIEKSKYARGFKVTHIKTSDIEKIPIPQPSFEVQGKIVSELDQINDLIRLKKEQLKEYDNLAQSIFYDMFGDPVKNEKGWKVKPLGELGFLGRGVSKHRPRNAPELLGGTMPLIQTGDVANSAMYLTEYNSTYSDLGVAQSKIWEKGTLCITIAATIGKCAILSFKACFPDSVVGFLCHENICTNVYMYFIFSCLQKILEEEAPAVAQKNINLKILNGLMIPLPPLPLQQEFSSRIEQIEKLKTEVQKTITDLETLLASRMQYWFE